jgi:uncharacterized membrane protein YphA (DoxX/SURF4 family)
LIGGSSQGDFSLKFQFCEQKKQMADSGSGGKGAQQQSAPSSSGVDPRRPDHERKVLLIPKETDAAPFNLSSAVGTLSLLCGLCCILFKMRVFALQAVFFTVVSILNMKPAERDVKQIFSAVFIAGMAIFMAYIGPASKTFT